MAYWRRKLGQMQAATDSVAVAPDSPVPVKPAKTGAAAVGAANDKPAVLTPVSKAN